MSTHQHTGPHDHTGASLDRWTAGFWDDRYSTGETTWSGQVNRAVAEEAAQVAPGRALEVGCGTGADAVWLAEQGWQVVATDVSDVALQRGEAAALEHDAEAAGRITWEQHDLLAWVPEPRSFELVTAAFFQLPPDPRRRVYAALADAVTPGGSLLLVLHDVIDLENGIPRPPEPDMFPKVEELVAELPRDQWEVVTAESRPRPGTLPDGSEVILHDAVLRAVRAG